MKANYFPIDRDDYTSIKSSDIIMNYGYEGYGIYFTMLQKLASTEARSIELSKIKILAYNMRVEEKLLRDIIHQYFDVEGDAFLSKSLNSSLGYYDAKYEKNSEGGKKAAANMTPEQRQERARKAAEARYNKSDEKTDPMLSTKQEMLSELDVDANNRIEKNRIERKEEKERERKESKNSSSSSSENKIEIDNTPKYDIELVQNEIKNHTPMFFNLDNTQWIISNYIEYMKVTTEPMLLKLYESIVYVKIIMNYNVQFPNTNVNDYNNRIINDYVQNTDVRVTPNDISSLFKILQDKSDMNKLYFQITKNKHHQLSMEVNQTNAHTEDNTPKVETEDNTPKVETEDNTPKVEIEDNNANEKFKIPMGREMTEEERKFLSDSLPF